MQQKRLFLCAVSLATVLALPGRGHTEPPRPPLPLAPTLQPPRQLVTALRPTALLVREGVALISDERHLLQRVSLGGAGASESVWSPALYPPRLLDGGSGTVIIADQRGEFIKRYTAERDPRAEDLASGQQVRTMARDASHLYWINLAAPHLRRLPLRAPNLAGARAVPAPPPAIEAVAALPEELVDLAVDAGEVLLANATSRSLQRLRAGGRPELVATFAMPPTVLHLTASAVFVGSRGGAVYRVERADGRVRELGRVRGDVSALLLAGCLLVVGSSAELSALDATRGIAVPLAKTASVTAIATAGSRVLYADFQASGLYEVPLPACPGPEAVGPAQPAPAAPPPVASPPPPAPPEVDPDPLAGKSQARVHTVQIRFATTGDELARQRVRASVERVLGEVASELWARASEAQVTALQKDGFSAVYRDGVDRLRCIDVRRNPDAARRPPPPPFFESGSPTTFLVQLNVANHVLPDLQNELAARGVTLLGSEEATLTVAASPSAIARLARQPYVTWTGAYGVRERLVSLAIGLTEQAEPCVGDPDRTLRTLAAWVQKQPQAKLKLTAVLFKGSAAFVALLRQEGARLESRDEQTVIFTIKRGSLPAVAAHPDVQVLEPYAEPSVD